MSARKLIAIDLDGTLVGEDLVISPADRAAVQAALAAGAVICIATGRLFSAARPFADALGLEGELIPLNGAAVYDIRSGALEHAVPLDRDIAVASLDALRAAGFRVQLYFDDRLYLDGTDERTDRYLRRSRVQPVMVPDLRLLLTSDPPDEPGPMKVLGIGPEPDVLAQIQALGHRFGDSANVFRSQREYLEVTDPRADKGAALSWVAERLGIAGSDIAAIGDSDNDAPMFARAAVSYAVASGTPLAKSRASHVVGPLGTGVAEALDDILAGCRA